MFAHEVGDDARIKIARSASHEESVKRGEAHRGINAAPVDHRAQARAVAKVPNDHPPARQSRIKNTQAARDKLVRQAMEAISPHALVFVGTRQSQSTRHCSMVWWNAVSKHATCGMWGSSAAQARI